MRTQLSVLAVAAGIVGTITAGTVSANVLMQHDEVASTTAAPAAPKAGPAAEPVRAPAAAAAPRTVVLSGTTAAKAATRKAAATKAAARKAPITYVVKPGDDLSSIAQWFALHGYGDLFRANRAVIGDNPNLIFPGQRITIARGRMTVRH